MIQYEFTGDYFSHNIPNWNKVFEYLNNTFGPNLDCLEVGAYEGRSALYTLDNYVGEGTLTTIDFFNINFYSKKYFNNLALNPKKDQVITITGNSVIELPKLLNEGKSYHFIYVDAGKTSAENMVQLLLCERLLAVNGIMIVDDYLWTRSEAVEEKWKPKLGIDSFKESTVLCEVVDIGYQVTFKKIKDNKEFGRISRIINA